MRGNFSHLETLISQPVLVAWFSSLDEIQDQPYNGGIKWRTLASLFGDLENLASTLMICYVYIFILTTVTVKTPIFFLILGNRSKSYHPDL